MQGRERLPPPGRDARAWPFQHSDPALISWLDRVPASRSSSAFGHHQIVAMNDLIATTVPEDLGDFTPLVARNPPYIGARIGRETSRGLDAGAGAYDHRVAALEGALDADYTRRQQARAAAQRSRGA